ncbi:AsmA family protein [Marinobacterium marinum]|uniref:AsmA family protein n=1 Tax=Marinobacterium marinum TaxID=2756129 RepID=A0A7W1WZG1_9GAMM|nr:AsmA family protein [Marinobacterium marinum]MBA4502958.1 AsmA family protein [Marinobacterium marinum]
MKAIKLLFAFLLGLLLLAGVGLLALTTLFDPNDYKDEIRDQALALAGVELHIEGNIGWSLYPRLALELNQVGVGYPDKPALGTLKRAEVAVSIPALIDGKLQMNRLLVDGLTLALVQNAQGDNNWTPLDVEPTPEQLAAVAAAKDEADTTPVPAVTNRPLALEIEFVDIRHAALTFIDQSNDSRIELQDLNLQARQISATQPFPLTLKFGLRQLTDNQLQLGGNLALNTDINLDLPAQHYRLNNLNGTLNLREGARLPAPLALVFSADLDTRLNEEQIEISQLHLQADPLTLSGHVTLNGFTLPQISGQLNSNTFNPRQLLAAVGLNAPATADTTALTTLAFDTTLTGPAGTLTLNPLNLRLDETRFNGDAALSLATQRLSIKLKGTALDADRYLPPAADNSNPEASTSSASPASAGTALSWSKEALIPLAPLRALNLDAALDLDSLKIHGLQLEQPGLSLSAHQGLVRLTRFNTRVFSGQVSTTAQLDARKTPLSITVAPRITGLQLGTALQTLAQVDVITGNMDSRADLSMSGQSIHAWIHSLNGSANVQMKEGVIKGIDAARSLCQGINNLSSLWINAEQVDTSTPFANLDTRFTLRNGVVSNRDLSVKLDAISVNGRGSINLPLQTLDYRIGMVLEKDLFNESCSVNNRLEGVEVPVDCKGRFDDEPAKLCRLDTGFITDIIKAEARRKVEDKVGTQLEEKLKDKLGEDKAGQVLKGLFGR